MVLDSSTRRRNALGTISTRCPLNTPLPLRVFSTFPWAMARVNFAARARRTLSGAVAKGHRFGSLGTFRRVIEERCRLARLRAGQPRLGLMSYNIEMGHA